MANCPNCGSDHIQLTTETNVNWGRAVVGWALFGVVGGAVGAVTGDDRKAIICLDCGTSWKPIQLHQIITEIEKSTNQKKIDLSKSSHRVFVNEFISKVVPHIKYIDTVEQQGKQKIKQAQSQSEEAFGMGYSILVISGVSGIFINGGLGFMIGLFIGIIPLALLYFVDSLNKQKNQRKIQNIQFETERTKNDAKEHLNRVLKNFISNHTLD